MTPEAEVTTLKAKSEAARQLSRLDGVCEPLTERQRELVLLLMAEAYVSGSIDALMGLKP